MKSYTSVFERSATDRPEDWSRHQLFSTGDLARLFVVAPRTASKWIDKGLLDAYRVPGSKCRRATRSAVLAFAEQMNMPQAALLKGRPVGRFALAVTGDRKLVEALAASIAGLATLSTAADSFDAGRNAEFCDPRLAVVDFSIGRHQALILGQQLRLHFPKCVRLGIVAEDAIDMPAVRNIYEEVFQQPVDPALVAACAARRLGMKEAAG